MVAYSLPTEPRFCTHQPLEITRNTLLGLTVVSGW
jgi:hypothetical protein